MKLSLKQAISEAIASAAGINAPEVLPLLEAPKKAGFGDLAFPCFQLAKARGKNPVELANELSQSVVLPAGIEAVVPAGPFLNFSFNRPAVIGAALDAINRSGSRYGSAAANTNRIVVEYSSPNIAKPFHVGHLRATLIGNSLDRIYRFRGCQTVSINHLGDWGTQFGFVWAGCKLWGKPEQATVSALVDLYRRSTKLKEQQEKKEVPAEDQNLPDVNEIARGFFLDLEENKPYAMEFWRWCLEISLKYLEATYDRLGIKFDHYLGESFYSDKLDAVKAELEAAGLLVQSQGAFGVDLGEQLGFARILTPDGRSLYLSRDIAAAEYRSKTFDFDRAIYVVGAPQTLHFQQLVEIVNRLGKDFASKIEHVAFGHVLGMKTRGEGEFIELNDFLDEAHNLSLQAYRDQVARRPEGLNEDEVAEAVSIAAIVFSNLSRSRLKDVHFKWEHALEFQGDTGPYLLYACARINGIKEKAAQNGITPLSNASLLTEDSAYQLAAVLTDFETVLDKVLEENEPAHLSSYALELSKHFSRAYNDLQVVGAEPTTAAARLSLFEAVRTVLNTALELLGMRTIERM